MQWRYDFWEIPPDVDVLVTIEDTETGKRSVRVSQRTIGGQWVPHGLKYGLIPDVVRQSFNTIAWMPAPEPAADRPDMPADAAKWRSELERTAARKLEKATQIARNVALDEQTTLEDVGMRILRTVAWLGSRVATCEAYEIRQAARNAGYFSPEDAHRVAEAVINYRDTAKAILEQE